MIWGVSSALFEESEIDRRNARYINKDFSDYLIPVNADVPSAEVILGPENDDIVNSLGMKGVGELGIVGMNAAIANAVYHATGRRIRELPIRIEFHDLRGKLKNQVWTARVFEPEVSPHQSCGCSLRKRFLPIHRAQGGKRPYPSRAW